MSSLAVALAHSRDRLNYDAIVAAYWPEFAWRGKGDITVRQLLSHQAGVPVLDIPLTLADLADLDLVATALALQRPLWPPGTRHGYHGITLGWYEGELMRRVDPAGLSLGTFFAEEIAAPLGNAELTNIKRRVEETGGSTGRPARFRSPSGRAVVA